MIFARSFLRDFPMVSTRGYGPNAASTTAGEFRPLARKLGDLKSFRGTLPPFLQQRLNGNVGQKPTLTASAVQRH